MKDFEFYKTIRIADNKKVKESFLKLHAIYKTIPGTKGCLDNIGGEGGCGAWCCKIQTPQLLYSEFLLIWEYISKEWGDDKIYNLLKRCMLNAINHIPSKGCVFFDEETNLCQIHEIRPYNCRIYGITSDEEFGPRYERLKKEYEEIIGAVIKPQCNLVSTIDETEVTMSNTDEWWNKLTVVERSIGIPMELVTDKIGGSYRTPHDHVLLYNMPENVLNALAGIKQYDDYFDKIIAVEELVNCIRNYFKEISK